MERAQKRRWHTEVKPVGGTMRCVFCTTGRLRPTVLTFTFDFEGNIYPLADPDGLLCDRCGEAFISKRASAMLLLCGSTAPRAPIRERATAIAA
jgi:YgiT-type zinc finger domain-containing protein